MSVPFEPVPSLPVPSLFVIEGRDQGRRFALEQRQVGVGRDAVNGVRLRDTEVSRRHAEVRVGEAGVEWVDLGSSNGSFVNSVRVQRQTLRSGDRVQVGRTLMIYTETPSPRQQANLASDRDHVDIVAVEMDAMESQIVRAARREDAPLLGTGPQASNDSWLAQTRSSLEVMYHTSLAVSHTLDIDQLLERILELIFAWVEADRGCVVLLDRATDQWVPKVRRDRRRGQPGSPRESSQRMAISRTILDYVRGHEEGVLTSDARDDGRWDPAASIVKYGVREAICVPMQGRYGTVGAIYIDTYTPPLERLQQPDASRRFSDDHLKLMMAIGHQAALAVEDTSYYSAMVQAERLAVMGQTIAGISHHVKNILQGMRGGSFLIQEGLKAQDWEVTRKGWDIVEKNQDRISTLVMDMLTFSKEREPDLMPGDINLVVGDVLELMAARAAEEQVQLVDARAPHLPPFQFDAEAIHRALLNVVANAIEACAGIGAAQEMAGGEEDWEQAWIDETAAGDAEDHAGQAENSEGQPADFEAWNGVDPAEAGRGGEPRERPKMHESTAVGDGDIGNGGAVASETASVAAASDAVARRVEVQTLLDAAAEKLVVLVRDNGPGIPPDQLPRIFAMFVSSKGHRGTGLGLAVSQKILREHGGQITVESELGRGSCFRLELPAISAISSGATGAFTTRVLDADRPQDDRTGP